VDLTTLEQGVQRDGQQWKIALSGHPGKMLASLLLHVPNAAVGIRQNRLVPGKVDLYQVTTLYMTARDYNNEDRVIVEFGTMFGWSASMLAAGAPKAIVHTLEPSKARRVKAKGHLAKHRNITVHALTSLQFQEEVIRRGVLVDLVYVDGDHHHCEEDMGWWDLIRPGGLMLFHDYTYKYQSVIQSVDHLLEALGKRQPDIALFNTKSKQGMVGVYK
jgi:predicted O-methyltransferase YrrM